MHHFAEFQHDVNQLTANLDDGGVAAQPAWHHHDDHFRVHRHHGGAIHQHNLDGSIDYVNPASGLLVHVDRPNVDAG